jgi:hypothetical protein
MHREYFSSFESSSNDDSLIESVDNKIKIHKSLESKNFFRSKYNHLYKVTEPKVAFKSNCNQKNNTKNKITSLLEIINDKKPIAVKSKTSPWMYLYIKLFGNNSKLKSFYEIFLRLNRVVFSNRIEEKLFEEDLQLKKDSSYDDRFVMYLINKVQYKSNFLKSNNNFHLLENVKKLMINKQNNSFESNENSNNKRIAITEGKFKLRHSIKSDKKQRMILSRNKKNKNDTNNESQSKVKKLINQIQKLKVITSYQNQNNDTKKDKKTDKLPALSVNTPSSRANIKDNELNTLNIMTTNESTEQFTKENAYEFNKTFEEKVETISSSDNKNKLEILFFQKLINSKVSKIKQSSRFLNEILFDIVKQEYEKKTYNIVYQDTINKFLYSNVIFKDCKYIKILINIYSKTHAKCIKL